MNKMHGTGALGLLLLTAFSAQAAKVYTWVDANGVPHYTDAPPPGRPAKEVDLRMAPLLGTSPHSVQVENFDSLTNAGKAKAATDPVVELLSPTQGKTLHDNTGNVLFQGQITPLPPQYDVRLTLNGKATPIVHNSLAIRVENLDRGAYEARLELLAKDGTVLAESKPVTFYLHRATIDSAPKVNPLNKE